MPKNKAYTNTKRVIILPLCHVSTADMILLVTIGGVWILKYCHKRQLQIRIVVCASTTDLEKNIEIFCNLN